MRILLVSMGDSRAHGNTGIDHIARYLRDALPTDEIETAFYFNRSTEDLKVEMPIGFDVYGFSIFEKNYVLAKEISGWLKRGNASAVTVFGGQFVTMNFKLLIDDAPDADYFVLGDGESPLLRLIEFCRGHAGKLIGDLNIATRGDVEGKRMNVELDVERPTSFDYYERDTRENNGFKVHALMSKSNICRGACTFCCSRKGRVSYRSSANVFDEIFYVSNGCGVKDFWITDDDIFDVDGEENRNRLNELLDRIDASGINIGFSAFAKPRSICNPDNAALLKKMSAVGCHHIFLGIDAGNDEDLKLYNKRSTLEQGFQAVNILREAGIGVRFGMIFLNPYSTLERMRNSYLYLLRLHSTNYFHFGGWRVQLLRGTRLFERVQRDGLLREDYSILNNQAFRFKHEEVEPTVAILDELMPQLDGIGSQFNVLRYRFYTAIHFDENAKRYEDFMIESGEREFQALKEYFQRLFVENDCEGCRRLMPKFVSDMRARAEEYAPIIKELKRMLRRAPLKKERGGGH